MDDVINYAWPVTSINNEDICAVREWIEKKKDKIRNRKLAIWGAGIRGTEFSILLKMEKINNIFFVDSNREKWRGTINEFPIIAPEELYDKMKAERIHILISTEDSKNIEEELVKRGYKLEEDFSIIKSNIYQKYINEFLREYKQNYLFMGDCEFSKISLGDVDTRNLGLMLKEQCGFDMTKVLAMHGMGLRAHYNIFKAQIARDMKPRMLIIMVNLDTLTGKQHLLPRSQHAELIQKIYDISDQRDEEFKEYVELVNKRSQNIQVEFSTLNRNIKQQNENDVKARNYFKLNYMYDLDVNTEGVIYLIKILQEAEMLGVKVLPFIPPVNYLFAESLMGGEFIFKYRQNIDKIRKIVENANVELLDLSFCLTPDMFAELNTPDETTNEFGRRKVADILVSTINKKINGRS